MSHAILYSSLRIPNAWVTRRVLYRKCGCGKQKRWTFNLLKTMNSTNSCDANFSPSTSKEEKKILRVSLLYVAQMGTPVRQVCSGRNFSLARNLIRRIISPNQDDLSYSNRISFPGSRNWVSCQTHSLWLNNAVQCRRLTGGSSIAAAAWTHEGTYLIYGFLASIFS